MSSDHGSERSMSRDQDGGLVRHKPSFEINYHIPMWDSSDPERAPPPLPLNPNPSAPAVKSTASAHIQAAAEALSAKSREAASPSAYISNAMPDRDRSPDKSLIRGAAHRRLQSLQTPSVKDLRSYLDSSRSPERVQERKRAESVTPLPRKEVEDLNSSPSRNATPTPSSRDVERRSSTRPTPKAILGDSTPPSATMLALQNYPHKDVPENPFSNVTNGSSPKKTPFAPLGDFGLLSTQITSLTTICTKMQTEMDKLSRRSKDNATDLVSLKEATNSRDEDIRKSLRDLVNKVSDGISAPGLMNSAILSTPPSSTRFQLPRIPTPGSMFDRVGSPEPGMPNLSVDGAASVAMLEKIIREMVTKDNQENLLSTLSQLFDNASKNSTEAAKKMEEMFKEMKAIAAATAQQNSRALVTRDHSTSAGASRGAPSTTGPLTLTTRDLRATPGPGADEPTNFTSPKAADFVSDEMIKLLKKIKESVTQSGGLLGEVKAQQRDLRGEVLHMGREIGRKIDEARRPASGAKAIEDGTGKQDVARIIQEGLADLKTYLDEAMRDKRRQSTSTTLSKASVNSQEVYDVVRHSLAQRGLDQMQPLANQAPGLDKEAILNAVKEAYEEYKPDVQVEQYGLERHEILDCLREGLEQHKPAADSVQPMSRTEIMEAIQEAMRNFSPPTPINEAHELRDEVLLAVRECLDEFKPSLALAKPAPIDQREQDRLLDAMREIIVETVKNAVIANGAAGSSREIEISQEDLYAAVANALNSSGSPFGRYGEQVVNQLHELVENMRVEFKEYSTANGRDTEQVLDALKDGLESLRGEIELYVDRAQDVTQKDEIIDAIRSGIDGLGNDVQTWCAAGPQGENAISRTDMLAYIKTEFDLLRQELTERDGKAVGPHVDNAAILAAVSEGFESLKTNVGSRELDASGEVDEAMKNELEQLRDTVLAGSSIHKDETLDTVRAHFDNLHGKIDGGAFSGGNEELLREIKEELEHLRESLAGTLTRATDEANHDAIREMLQDLRQQMTEQSGNASKELLDNIKAELESLRETLNSAITGGTGPEKDEILAALKSTSESVQNLANKPPAEVDAALLGAMRGEFEVLRSAIGQGFSRSLQTADREDILEALRLGFDDLRSDLVKKMENPEPHMRATNELLDALNEGLEGIKTEVKGSSASIASKTIDMTVSYEILDTLKEGISSLRADIDKLKEASAKDGESAVREAPAENAIVLAEVDGVPSATRDAPTEVSSNLQRDDIEKLEVMLAQLSVKVEAVDANISDPAFRPSQEKAEPAEGTALKTDLEGIALKNDLEGIALKTDLEGIEKLVKDLQGTVDVLASRAEVDVAVLPRKEDMDAIETLLSNTKAKLEEIQVPDLSAVSSKEQVEAIESLLKSTREAVDELNVKIEDNVARKEQITAVETLVTELKAAIEEVKTTGEDLKKANEETEGKVQKSDVDAVGLIALEIKDKIAAMKELEDVPTKADVEQLTGLIHDFRESHDKLKENYENDVAVTAKAFDDRKQEAEDIVKAVEAVKAFLTDVKDELKSKLDTSAVEATTLSDSFKVLEKTIEGNFNVMGDVKELMEIVNREFERIHGTFEDQKVQREAQATEEKEKHDTAKEAVIAGISTKLDEKFDAIMSKYDDAQAAAETQVKTMEERTAEQIVLLQSTKELSDELKLSCDTLGTTLTAIDARFTETVDKISSDSQIVFGKLETVAGSLEALETREAAKTDHESTRVEVTKVLDVVTGVSTEATEFHPKFMTTLQELQALIQQHYDHSQKTAEAATEQTRSMHEEIKSSVTGLPALLPAPAVEVTPEYDDAEVQEKLNKVMSELGEVKISSAQLNRLDKIHEQVMSTAAEVSAFVATQTRLIEEGHESREREAADLALLVERRLAQKESLEGAILDLRDEKESMLALIDTLHSERDALAMQKARLSADLAAMHTALSIRQDELDAMDAKADALERRVIDGIMNQSRLLMMAKGAQKAMAPANGTRAASNASHSTVGQMGPLSAAGQGLSMALKNRTQAARRSATMNSNATARRVMSLNPISGNAPTGPKGFSAINRGALDAGFLKRSQSVRTNKPRKVSWHSGVGMEKDRAVSVQEIAEDKENEGRFGDDGKGSEADHDGIEVYEETETEAETEAEIKTDDGAAEDDADDNAKAGTETIAEDEEKNDADTISESGTERRLSHVSEGDNATSSSYANSVSDDSFERRSSKGTVTGSEVSSSYMTGSEVSDRRTSYSSSVRSTLGTHSDDEEDEDSDGSSTEGETETQASQSVVAAGAEGGVEADAEAGAERDPEIADGVARKDMVVYSAPSDSGLGSDLPTATMSGSETDYFRRKAEESS